jgi:hypothetical protein
VAVGVFPDQHGSNGLGSAIGKSNSDAVLFYTTQNQSRDASIVRPDRVLDAGVEFDGVVERKKGVFTERLTILKCRHRSQVEIGEQVEGVEIVAFVVDFTFCGGHCLSRVLVHQAL